MITPEIFEGFAIETAKGLIFTVKGLLHPPDRVIAYLRYLPDPQGDRQRRNVSYRRIYDFEKQLKVLQSDYPDYLYDEPAMGIQVQSVPWHAIRRVYDPRHYLRTLLERGPSDEAEGQALQLARLLQEKANVPLKSLGISGSLMLGLHRRDSDIDLLVYGAAASRAVHWTLSRLINDSSSPVRPPDREELAALHATHRPDTPLSPADFGRLQRRKVNEGWLQGPTGSTSKATKRQYFVRFVKLPNEYGRRYGERRFESMGPATLRGHVIDDREAIFTPCHYVIRDVKFVEGKAIQDVTELVSFRGRFSDQARAGEEAVAKGQLERVFYADGRTYHRLVIGGQRGDYLMALAPAGMAARTVNGIVRDNKEQTKIINQGA